VNRNIKLLYGFSFFDPFMLVCHDARDHDAPVHGAAGRVRDRDPLRRGVAEPPASPDRRKPRSADFKEVLSSTLVRDAATRLVFLNLVVSGAAGLVMVWTRQKYWQDIGVPLAYFSVLFAVYKLLVGLRLLVLVAGPDG
jgi:hypothetical protein